MRFPLPLIQQLPDHVRHGDWRRHIPSLYENDQVSPPECLPGRPRAVSEMRVRRSEIYFRLYTIITFFVSLNGKPPRGTAIVSMWSGKLVSS